MDIVCFSHLRWDFVYQRPQQLMSRFAKNFRVFFIEEPIYGSGGTYLDTKRTKEGVWVIVPHLVVGIESTWMDTKLKYLLQESFKSFDITDYIIWYYTPMALSVGQSFSPKLVVYDCMDELSAFKNAPALLREKEMALIGSADLLFTGGASLFESKKQLSHDSHLFPSSIDKDHFAKARTLLKDPADQSRISKPRIGYFGVIDERMDLELVAQIAARRPDWSLVMIGPVVKIDTGILPKYPNIHYLGSKSYDELPNYLAGWDVAIMPFAINESTKYISPTKTPEYLAGGKPVVSTAIRDVVDPYGKHGLVAIAKTSGEFIESIESQLHLKDTKGWLKAVDAFLNGNSWDTTVEKMMFLINTKIEARIDQWSTKKGKSYV